MGTHFDRIRDNWLNTVTEEDTVLIPGDISWALKLEQAKYDFGWIDQLPGRKVMSPGNHCYYAASKSKVRQSLPAGMEWIDGDYTVVGDYAVVATRGWILPEDANLKVESVIGSGDNVVHPVTFNQVIIYIRTLLRKWRMN